MRLGPKPGGVPGGVWTGYLKPSNEVGSLSLVKWVAEFEPGTFYSALTHKATLSEIVQ